MGDIEDFSICGRESLSDRTAAFGCLVSLPAICGRGLGQPAYFGAKLARLALQILGELPVGILLDFVGRLGGQLGQSENLVLKNFQAILQRFYNHTYNLTCLVYRKHEVTSLGSLAEFFAN